MRQNKLMLFIALGLWFTLLFPIKYIDPELEPYEQSYNRIVAEYCDWKNLIEPGQTIIKFSDLPIPTIGQCTRRVFGWVIEIDRTFWENAPEDFKMTLMAHELSHCKLGLAHNENNPESYMYPSLKHIEMDTLIYQVLVDAKRHCTGN